ncbi:MAG: helix-turn-helix domain-containing protein [Actinomycetota bacterium]|nr:helix-turn-helix domain-containing protein [Actinomycetota bacterium]
MTALERRVLALAYGEGLTQAQIADSLAVSRSAVSRAVLRAMHLVADSVEAEADAR